MNGADTGPDRLMEASEAAVRQARIVAQFLRDMVIPALKPQRRGFAKYMARQIECGALLDQVVLRDLESFIAAIDREIAEGTWVGWEADEHHVRGGWEVVYRDDRAAALARAAHELDCLYQAIAAVFDLAQATRLVETLIQD